MVGVIVRVGMVIAGAWGVIASSGRFSLGHSGIVPVPQVDCLAIGTRVAPSRSPIIYLHFTSD